MQIKATFGKACLLVAVTFASIISQGSTSANNLFPMPPMSPTFPNCGNHFPGTPEWNACFANFQQGMNNFQQQMQEFGQKISATAAANVEGSNTNYFSEASSSKGSSFSRVMTNGYVIQASGMPISTSTEGTKINIFLRVGSFDSFETKTEENEIELKIKKGDQQKWAKVQVPQGINLEEVKVERSSDTILITGPTVLPSYDGSISPALRSAANPTTKFRSGPGIVPHGGFQQSPQMWFF